MSTDSCFFCWTTDDLTPCELCSTVSSCSTHFELHRSKGSKTCLPFRVQTSAIVGRFLIASRDIKEGDLVIFDEALVLAPEDGSVCYVCLTNLQDKETPTVCSECSVPLCGESCQTGANHVDECVYLSRLSLTPDQAKRQFLCSCIGVLRILLAKKKSLVASEIVANLMGHEETRREDRLQAELLRGIECLIRDKCGLDWVTSDELAHAYGVLQTNAIGYRDANAYAFYPTISLMSHSCYPNLDRLTQFGDKFGFRAQRHILSGEELTIRYTRTLEHRLALRSTLKTKWHFDCSCQRCQDPTDLGSYISSPLCKTCHKPLVPKVPLDLHSSWNCLEQDCPDVSEEYIIKLDKIARDIIAQVDTRDSKQLKLALATLNKAFHHNYHQSVKLKFDFIMNGSRSQSLEDLQLVDELSHDVISVLDHVDKGKTRLLQNIKCNMARTKVKLLSELRAQGKITQKECLVQTKLAIALSK